MKKANVSELKNRLSHYLRFVRAGQSVLVYDRDQPIARIDPVGDRSIEGDWLADLQTRGTLRKPAGKLPPDWSRRRVDEGGRRRSVARRARRRPVRFWDSSAVIPLLVEQPASATAAEWLTADGAVAIWALTPVEVTSTLWRLVRENHLLEITREKPTPAPISSGKPLPPSSMWMR